MNTRALMLGAAVAAVLNCVPVNAQVLGGNIGGGLSGALSGGMRDMSVITQGSAAASLGADLDTGSLRRTTRDTLDRTTTRVRDTAGAARKRAESELGEARNVSSNVAASAAASATQAVDTRQIAAATNVAGSAASNVSTSATQMSGAASGAANVAAGQTAPTDAGLLDSGTPDVLGKDVTAVPESAKDTEATSAPVNGGALGALDASGSATGSASGKASAPKHGVSAQTSAQGSGSASVSTSR